mgnify:CR=1 FL=1
MKITNKTILINCNLSNNLIYPYLDLLKSSIPEGNYYLSDLYKQQEMGTIAINSQGGFESLNLFSNGLGPLESSIILISPDSSSYNSIENNIIISPNPATSNFSIFLEGQPFHEAIITIFSPEGKMIFETKMKEELLIINSKYWKKAFYLWLMKLFAKKVSLITTSNQESLRTQEVFPQSNVLIIPIFFDFNKLRV